MKQRGPVPLGPSRWDAEASESLRPATDLAAARERLLARGPRELDAVELREAWLNLHESWLTTKAAQIGLSDTGGFAIIATGGLGRRELLPHSDLDLLLLHDDMPADVVGRVADLLWYPLWDANIRLDHCVRTVADALHVAKTEISAGLAMLEARHIAGNAALSAQLVAGVRQQWRFGIRCRFDELVDVTRARWHRSGEIAHRAEPDLKYGRGGLRDVQLLDALAIAQLADRHIVHRPDSPGGSLTGAYRTLLDIRTELHRVSGRERDVLLAQYADEISTALGLGDRFDLARRLSDAARTISYRVDAGLRTAANSLPRQGISGLRWRRRPLEEGVVEYAGEVVLARDARPERDPGLLLRVAAASAVAQTPIAAATLSRLADTAPELHTPWPPGALDDLLVLLGAGRSAVVTIESLDRAGLWGRMFPEWSAIRDLPPRDVVHTWTVDRHLVETAVQASAFTTRVARPDLLVLGALLHDIGKGRGGDHSEIGAELAAQIGTRLGMPPADVERLSALVRHHLLLVKMATRRDLNDPQTITTVANAVGGDPVLLDVLHALTMADALATGPGMWGEWKESLVGELVRRCRAVMAGEPMPRPDPLDPRYLSLAEGHEVHVEVRENGGPRLYRVVMIAPNRRGLLSKAAGVLALNSLRVHSAAVNVHRDTAINEFVVSPHFGSPAAADLLRQQFVGALAGEIDVLGMLERRSPEATSAMVGEVRAGVPAPPSSAAPRIRWFDGTAPGQRIVEIRTTDRIGLLALLTRALERAGADIVWAKVTTVGSTVDDTFCVVLPGPVAGGSAGEPDSSGRVVVQRELAAVLPAAANTG
ncbi:MAG: [protein-PII] uridylyltransferase [Mycobacterium sp.]|uniref:[protein-PII] uridylyltransferase n=1 Tax=Mycobacterium sp. TaxID=1785 RepID=UPI00261639D9|nr:[protein-PII] uridylyltransferase [Mycobacterium sp.]MDI3314295.1 [protein-PII] uridylyltransferase [Mycobacterium sp.]